MLPKNSCPQHRVTFSFRTKNAKNTANRNHWKISSAVKMSRKRKHKNRVNFCQRLFFANEVTQSLRENSCSRREIESEPSMPSCLTSRWDPRSRYNLAMDVKTDSVRKSPLMEMLLNRVEEFLLQWCNAHCLQLKMEVGGEPNCWLTTFTRLRSSRCWCNSVFQFRFL